MTDHDTQADIGAECDALKAMLLAKNLSYGDSALSPLRVFSRASTSEQIRVRIDDKLSRLQRGDESQAEDTVLDLIGYLILYRIALRRAEPVVEGVAFGMHNLDEEGRARLARRQFLESKDAAVRARMTKATIPRGA